MPASPSPAPTLAAMREKWEEEARRLGIITFGLRESGATEDAAAYESRAAEARLLASALADSERLEWLERKANGEPIEVDSFTCVKDDPAVFLTVYPCTGGTICEQDGCANRRIAKQTSHRLGQGRTLREAIDAARLASGGES